MTTSEKLKIINDKIVLLNNTILKYKKWKIYFENKGTNDYCLVINNKAFSFATYGSVTSCLELLEYMFSKALEERKK